MYLDDTLDSLRSAYATSSHGGQHAEGRGWEHSMVGRMLLDLHEALGSVSNPA